MRRRRIAFLAWAGACIALASSSFLACSSDPTQPGVAPIYLPEAGVIEASSPEEAAAPPPGYDGGVGLGLADVADTPCSARSGPFTVVLPAPPDGGPPVPPFRALQRVADRRFADAEDGTGFVVFDADGRNGTFVATAPIGSELGLSADELERSLASLAARGLIVRNAAGGATISPEGHANAIT